MKFSHLHVHTQYSLLDGAADISELYKKAVKEEMPAIAITDHGNMFGVFKFVAEAFRNDKEKGIVNVNPDGTPKVKPIVGCEFYVVENRHKRQFTKEDKDQRYHQLMLAKNPEDRPKDGLEVFSKIKEWVARAHPELLREIPFQNQFDGIDQSYYQNLSKQTEGSDITEAA